MSWLFLFVASIFEVVWAAGFKLGFGLNRPFALILNIVCIVLSMYFLNLALRHLPLGTAYAVWTGLGAVGTLVVGIIFFKEPADFIRLASASLILLGLLGLKMAS